MPQENSENVESNKGTLKCQLCGLVASSAESFSEHVKKEHGDITSIIGEDVALRPMQPIRPAETRNTRNKIHRCKQCNFESPTKELHWKHRSTHIRKDKRLYCPKCAFVTDYKRHLEYHVRNHYGSKPFHCTKCSYTCVTKFMLKNHMKSHSDKFLYYCNNCDFQSKHGSSMKRHADKFEHIPLSVSARTNAASAAKKNDKSSPTEELNLTSRPRNQGKSSHRANAVAQISQLGKKPLPAMSAASLPLLPLKLSPSAPNPLLMPPFWQFNNLYHPQTSTANAAAAYFNSDRHSGIHHLFPLAPSFSSPTSFATPASSSLVLPPPSYSTSWPSLASLAYGTSPDSFFGAFTASIASQAKSNMATAMFPLSTGGEKISPLWGMPSVFSPQSTGSMPSVLQRLPVENESSSRHPLNLSTVRTPEEDLDIMAVRQRSHKGKASLVDPQPVAMVTDKEFPAITSFPHVSQRGSRPQHLRGNAQHTAALPHCCIHCLRHQRVEGCLAGCRF